MKTLSYVHGASEKHLLGETIGENLKRMVENYANDMLKNKDNARNLLDRAMENKIIDSLKTTLGVEEKSISLDEFRKFFEKEEDKSEEA